MNHDGLRRMAAWPLLIVIACVLLLAGCQDGSGPSLTAAPDAQLAALKKPPQPPPPPADPAIVFQGADGLTVINADGSNMTTISTDGTQGPSWSPGGDAIALDGEIDGVEGILRVDVEVVAGVPIATNPTMLVVGPNDGLTGLIRPAWSPVPFSYGGIHAEWIAYARYGVGNQPPEFRRIEMVPAEGGDPVILYTSESGGALDQATWRWDATEIAFTEGGSLRSTPCSIRVVDVASGHVYTALDGDWSLQVDGRPFYLDWARTQDALVFHAGPSGRNGYAAVYMMQKLAQPETWGEPTFVVGGDRRDEAITPSWSPDDSEIVFSRDWQKLQKINLATREVTDLTGRRSGGKFPDWRRF